MATQYTSTVSNKVSGKQTFSTPSGTRLISSGGGTQYTSTVSLGFSDKFDQTPETLFSKPVRSAMQIFLERRDQRIIDLALTPGDEEEVAQLCWGGINRTNPRAEAGEEDDNHGSRVVLESGENKDEEPPKKDDNIYRWSEQERFVVKTKITNPEDTEQYIWVDVVKMMVVVAPSQFPFNGKIHTFQFSGKRTQIGIDEGGSGESSGDEDEDEVEASSGSPTPGPSGRTTGTGTVGTAGTNTGSGAAAP